MSTAPAMLLSSRCIQGPERTSIVKSEAGADLSTPLETQLESVLRAGSGPFLASLPLTKGDKMWPAELGRRVRRVGQSQVP